MSVRGRFAPSYERRAHERTHNTAVAPAVAGVSSCVHPRDWDYVSSVQNGRKVTDTFQCPDCSETRTQTRKTAR